MKRRKYFWGALVGAAAKVVVPALISGAFGGGGGKASSAGGGGAGSSFVDLYSELQEGTRERKMQLEQVTRSSGDNSMGELASEILNDYLETVPSKDRESAQKELNKFFMG